MKKFWNYYFPKQCILKVVTFVTIVLNDCINATEKIFLNLIILPVYRNPLVNQVDVPSNKLLV